MTPNNQFHRSHNSGAGGEGKKEKGKKETF